MMFIQQRRTLYANPVIRLVQTVQPPGLQRAQPANKTPQIIEYSHLPHNNVLAFLDGTMTVQIYSALTAI